MTRNSNGKSTANKIKTWYSCQISLGIDPKNGKEVKKTFTGKTKHEALKKKDDYLASFVDGSFIETPLIQRQYAEWLRTHKDCLPF
jgi:hypothetical protein